MKKPFLCKFSHYAGEKLSGFEKCFGEKSKNQDKLIQSRIPGQHTKNRHLPAKPGQLECLMNGIKYKIRSMK